MIKLKALGKRAHNIMFHTHTVAGIVISFALFIIFYAGAFSLFRDELYQWENSNARFKAPESISYDKAIKEVERAYPNFKKEVLFRYFPPNAHNPFIGVNLAVEKENGDITRVSALIHPETYEVLEEKHNAITLAETIYHLHYFRQIPVAGIWLSGLVALFFLFAIITGLLIHWKNLIQKFYAFTTKGKWKQIWTNAHTSLGFIGLPFQLVFAVTGSLLGLSTFLLAPSVLLLFDGNSDPIFENVQPGSTIAVDEDSPLYSDISLDTLMDKVTTQYPEAKVQNAAIKNYGREDALITYNFDDKRGLTGDGTLVLQIKDAAVIKQVVPYQKTYSQAVYKILVKLHYATFGGYLLKVVYFILAMITCFIIISGVLIWRTARDNDKYTLKQRRFHHNITKVYLSICLSMFPAIALIFIANKAVSLATVNRIFYVNSCFFISWLLLILIGLFWNNYKKMNINYLILGSILSFGVPIANGWVTGDWFWTTLSNDYYNVASVDISWLLTGLIGLLTSVYLRRKQTKDLKCQQKTALSSQ